jgi:tetratricopeptide (TPR) repeat protein
MIVVTLALMTGWVVLKASEPDTVRKIARITANEGMWKWDQGRLKEAEDAFARAIALNPDEVSLIKLSKLESELRKHIYYEEIDEALKEGDEAIAADKAALEHVIHVYTESGLVYIGSGPVPELRKLRQRAVYLAETHHAPPELLKRAVKALASVAETTSDDSK